MPLFGSKFSPKKSLPRKSPSLSNLNLDASARDAEFGLDVGPIKLKLGDNEITFEEGQWVSETSVGGNSREMAKIRKQNQILQEENNLLKVKMELTLEMLAQTTAEVHLQENEIEQLKKLMKNQKRK